MTAIILLGIGAIIGVVAFRKPTTIVVVDQPGVAVEVVVRPVVTKKLGNQFQHIQTGQIVEVIQESESGGEITIKWPDGGTGQIQPSTLDLAFRKI